MKNLNLTGRQRIKIVTSTYRYLTSVFGRRSSTIKLSSKANVSLYGLSLLINSPFINKFDFSWFS